MCSPDAFAVSGGSAEWGSCLNRWWAGFSRIASLHYSYCGVQLFPGLADLVMQVISRLVAGVHAATAACLASKRHGGTRWWQPGSGRRGVGGVPQEPYSLPQLAKGLLHLQLIACLSSWCWGWVAAPCLLSIGQSWNVSVIKQSPSCSRSLCKSLWS